MRKLQFFLVFVLCVSGSLQKEGKTGNKTQENVAVVRTFQGFFPTQPPRLLNGTRAPSSPLPPSTLRLGSNSTAAYLNGTLSTRVIPVIYILVVIVGIPANVAILATLGTKIRRVSSALLYCSLAVSDLFLLLSLFFKAHYHLRGNHWELGETACRVVTACFYGNLYCSAQTLACISIKRYLAIVHPFMYKTLPKRMCTVGVSLAVWVVFGAAVVPELLVKQTYWLPELGHITCHDVLPLAYRSHKFLLNYNLFLTSFGLLVPLVVTVICQVWILCELKRSHLDWGMYMKASSLVLVIFMVCFTPAGLLHFLHLVQMSVNRTENLYVYFNVAVCLCCLHACLDPFLFLIMSKSVNSRLQFKPFNSKTTSISI